MLCNEDNDAIRDILKALKAAEIIMFTRLRNTIDDKLDVLTSDMEACALNGRDGL